MKTDYEDFLTSPSAPIREVMSLINANASGIALVVEEDARLLGTVTDGDIRRGLLRGVDLDAPVREVMFTSPRVATTASPPEELEEIFRGGVIRTIPVLDEEGRLIGVHELREWLEASEPLTLPAVLMAGGLGTRLRPLTEDTPKPLLPVAGKPILERTIEHLQASGIEEIVITTRYLAEQIEEYCGDGEQWNVGIDYLRERERLGTAGALRLLEGSIDQPFLVMNGDLLTDFNVRSMFDFHREQRAAMTVAVRHYSFKVPYGVARVEDVYVQELIEKPTYDFFVNAGIYILEPWVIEHIPQGQYYDITELIDALIAQGHPVASFPIFETWMDIGRPEDLEMATAHLKG